MKRWIRRGLIAFVSLVVLVLVVFWWVVSTNAGARFALHRAIAVTHGRLTINDVQGTLGSRVVLDGVSWKDEGVEARIQRVDLDFAVMELLRRRVHITALQLTDVRLVLNTATEQPKPPEQAPISLAAPLTIRLDTLHVQKGGITQNGKSILEFDTVDLAAAWTAEGIGLQDFKLRAPAGEVDVSAQIGAGAGFPGGSDARFRWRFAERTVAGTLHTHSDGARVQVGVVLTEPTAAKVDMDVAATGRHDWKLALNVPQFDPKRVLPDTTLTGLSVDLNGEGDAGQGRVAGMVDVNGHRVVLDPLHFAYADQHLKLDPLSLRSSDAAGQFDVRGDIDLAAKPPRAKLDIGWTGVELPEDIAGQKLASHGQLYMEGSAEQFTATGSMALGPHDRMADLRFDIDGTPKAITLKELAVLQTRGSLTASGDVQLDPKIGWKIQAKAAHFDPGAIARQWPGDLNFELDTQGTLTDQGPDAQIKLTRLDGTLRQRALKGTADLHVEPGYIVDGTLAIASGDSNLAVTGRGGQQTDADVGFTLASLADVLPQAQGALTGRFTLKGRWPALAANGHVSGKKLGFGDNRVASVELDANVKDVSAPAGQLNLVADQISAGSLSFTHVEFTGDGDQSAHRVQLSAKGEPLGIDMELRGANGKDGWQGTLQTLALAVKDMPSWRLDKPAAVAWRGGTTTVSELCLVSDGPRVCVAGSSAADGSADGRYAIEHLPLAFIAKLASPDALFRLTGDIDGSGGVKRGADGSLSGSASLHSAAGNVAYPDTAEQPLLDYTGFAIEAQLTPQQQQATLHAVLSHDGKIDGAVQIGGAQKTLSGDITLALNDLGFVEMLSTDVAAVKGRIDGRFILGGSLDQPAVSGALNLLDFAAEVPAAGLKLHDGHIAVIARDLQHTDIEGTLASGDGKISLKGNVGAGADAPLSLTLNGSDFLAADIPAAHVVISPALKIQRDQQRLNVEGEVSIPRANVDLSKLPGGGAARTSPDVVVVDVEQTKKKDGLPLFAEVTVKLGDAVKLKGFGLDGGLEGQIAVTDHPGKQTTGRGEIRVSGTYKAYGQDLTIQTGRLQFAGTAIDNPGLDLRAIRKIDDEITAGLRVQGTAQVPVLTVYAEPAMEQAEALSYLITGKPLSALKSGEGDMVGTAARALGSATGDLLAKSVGARLGVDAGVSDNAALGGAALTVGKFLSPKLYLSYGVGLFVPGEVITLRYILSKRWNLEAQSATNDNRAGINYRWEK